MRQINDICVMYQVPDIIGDSPRLQFSRFGRIHVYTEI
jgi:hypothetical protein